MAWNLHLSGIVRKIQFTFSSCKWGCFCPCAPSRALPEKTFKDNFLNGSWFTLMISFKENVLLFSSWIFIPSFFFLSVDRRVSWDPLQQPWQKGCSLQAFFLQPKGASAPPEHSHSASVHGCHLWRKPRRRPWAPRKRSESDIITKVACHLV